MHGSVSCGQMLDVGLRCALLAGERTEVNDLVEFVDDFTTENLFEHILKGHDTTHTAELVDDHYQVLPLLEEMKATRGPTAA